MAETGKKMGDYTPLESNKKDYFFGDGEGGVVAVGKTEAGGTKTNRLVKLSDIVGDKLPSGGTEGQVLTKTSGGAAWTAVPSELPSGGTTGQVLTKTSNGEAWADAPKELPTSGSAGQFLKKTANGVEYASVNEVPSGGITGQVLTKTASGEAWADAPKELPTSGTAGQFLKKTENGVEYASVSEVPSGGTTGQVLIKTANGVEWGNSEVVKFTGTLNPDAVPPDYSGMPSAADVKAAIQAGKHVILSLDDTTGHPVQYFYTHSHGNSDFYFVGFPRINAAGDSVYNRTYINALNTYASGPDSMGWISSKYLFADWPLNDGGVPTGNAGDVLTVIANQYGTKSMTWATPSAGLPSGGTNGQVLTKTASGNEWANAPTELPSSGTAGQFLKKTANGVEYDSVNQVPSSGTTGHVLRKTASGYDFESVNEVPSEGTAGHVLTKTENGFEWSAVPTELPSSTQFDKDKVLVRTETGYDWKYVVPLRWFVNTPDDATLEIDNNSYRNVIVDSCNNITFNVTTSSTHDFPNFVIDIHIDPNASIETLKINVTWTIDATEHAGVETLHCPVTGNTLTVLPGEYYQLCAVGQCWRIDKFIEPPSEGVEYLILQNFVAGHSIGTPSKFYWLPNVLTEEECEQYGNGSANSLSRDFSRMVNTTAGQPCIDSGTDLDFSKYGINGMPCALAGIYGEYDGEVGFELSTDTMKPLTVETFVLARHSESFGGAVPLLCIGTDEGYNINDSKAVIYLSINAGATEGDDFADFQLQIQYHGGKEVVLGYFSPEGVDNVQVYLTTLMLNHWNHIAICIDTTNIYVFFAGKCRLTVPLSQSITLEYTEWIDDNNYNERTITKTLGEYIDEMDKKVCVNVFGHGNWVCFDAEWCQFAVCKACKWTTDFTVPTEAY